VVATKAGLPSVYEKGLGHLDGVKLTTISYDEIEGYDFPPDTWLLLDDATEYIENKKLANWITIARHDSVYIIALSHSIRFDSARGRTALNQFKLGTGHCLSLTQARDRHGDFPREGQLSALCGDIQSERGGQQSIRRAETEEIWRRRHVLRRSTSVDKLMVK